MEVFIYTSDFYRLPKKKENFLKDSVKLPWSEQMRIEACPFRVHLICGQPSIYGTDDEIFPSNKEFIQLHKIWSQFVEDLDAGLSQFFATVDRLDELGHRVNEPLEVTTELIYQFPHISSDPDDYFIFISDQKNLSNIVYDLHYLAHLWQFEKGNLLLHASAVIHQEGIYLFSGPSGIGKSTIAKLSEELGDEILDEDIVSIYKTDSGWYSANAWGYNTALSDLPIRAFFFLFQDSVNHLVPLPQIEVAVHVWDQAFIILNRMLPIDKRGQLFSRAAEFARHIPGYELYFRKSPDFWKLIEAEIKVG